MCITSRVKGLMTVSNRTVATTMTVTTAGRNAEDTSLNMSELLNAAVMP